MLGDFSDGRMVTSGVKWRHMLLMGSGLLIRLAFKAEREDIRRKRKWFMIRFAAVMLTALLLIIGLWNRTSNFKAAYWQAALFLEVMNWYDGIVIDRLWVGHSKFWVLPGTEDLPFVKTWRQVLVKRGIGTLLWLVLAAAAAGLVVLIF